MSQSKLEQLSKDFLRTVSTFSTGQLPPGIFFNENHRHKFPKKFLTANLQYLKDIGIETLFLEFFLYDRHQDLLNVYNSSQPDAPLPQELKDNLEQGQASYYGHTGPDISIYTDVIIAAHQAGIRLVALDSKAAHPCHSFGGWLEDRKALFNLSAAKIIEKEHGGKPYIVYTGLIHGYKNGMPERLGATNTYTVFLTDAHPSSYPVDIEICVSDFLADKYLLELEDDCVTLVEIDSP